MTMPELAQVKTPLKIAGFVQSQGGSKANKRRIEESEAELKALMEEQNNDSQEPDSEAVEATEIQDEGNPKQKRSQR